MKTLTRLQKKRVDEGNKPRHCIDLCRFTEATHSPTARINYRKENFNFKNKIVRYPNWELSSKLLMLSII
jgi:hypothetical protein